MFASHETAAETKALYEAHIAWLSCMRSEVCRELPLHQYDRCASAALLSGAAFMSQQRYPGFTTVHMDREDPLPLPEDVLAFVEIVKRRAEADHDWAMTKPRARVHMDAGLVSFVFGHVAPVRPSVLASLTRPDYTGPCMHPDCRGPKTCKGNSLRWTTAGHVDLVFRAAHHKMARKRRFAPIGPVVLPRALTKVRMGARSQCMRYAVHWLPLDGRWVQCTSPLCRFCAGTWRKDTSSSQSQTRPLYLWEKADASLQPTTSAATGGACSKPQV